MFHTYVPKRFWSDDVMSACYLINRIPTKILNDLSPFILLNKNKSSLDYLHLSGCSCFVLIQGLQRSKFEAKSTKVMFISYSPTHKCYKWYNHVTRMVLVPRDVKFMEAKGYYEEKSWDDLKDLSQESDKATNLWIILERIGIHLYQDQERGGGTSNPSQVTEDTVV